MKKTLLALGALLLVCGLSRAEYVVIIANLTANATETPGMGMTGGAGVMGGSPPIGMPPTGPGGGRVGGAGASGSGPGFMGGMPPSGGIPPTGGEGPGRPGMGGGAIGGVGFPGLQADPEAADELATLVVAVIEVRPQTAPAGYVKAFEAGYGSLWFNHRWGGRAQLQKQIGPNFEVSLVTTDGRPMPTVLERYMKLHTPIFTEKDKATPEALLGLARKALEYGLVSKYEEVMKKLAEVDKTGPQVKKYLEVKAALEKPMPVNETANAWKGRLLTSYKVVQSPDNHFALIHNETSDEVPAVKDKLARLERTFRGIYYWWAMQAAGTVMPMPKERLISVLVPAADGEDFNKLKRQLMAGPIISDSFHARREGLAVFSGRRGDEHYEKLDSFCKSYWENGFNRSTILTGKPRVGIPPGKTDMNAQIPRTAALVLKALEYEWETNAATHEVARQIPFATGMLAAKVHHPEWIQFGMGSLFEAPLQSPWQGIGAPNSYYLPRFRENYKSGKYGDSKTETGKLATMVSVVTDDLFRAKPKKGPDGKDEPEEAVQRRARAAAWSLTFYLAQNDLAGLQRYFQELSKLPRDVELDRVILLNTFARAFKCSKDGKADDVLLKGLATRWLENVNRQTMEGEKIHEQIRKAYATVRRNPNAPTGGVPGGGFPPGMGPGGSTGAGPMGR